RFTAVMAWAVSFVGRGRGQLSITSQMIYARLAMSAVQEQTQDAEALAATERAEQAESDAAGCGRRAQGRLLSGASHRQLANHSDFGVLIGPSIGPQQIVEPDFRNRCVRVVPGIPREVGLGLAGDPAPVECTNIAPLRNGENLLDG